MMMIMWLILILVISPQYAAINDGSKCSVDASPRPPKYHLMEKCYRSKLGIVSKANFTSVISCHRLGIEKKGLAINYSPQETWAEAHVNSSCVPALGMFYIVTKKMNYTQGLRQCKNISALPADVTSEQRTDALSQLLAGASVDEAFVGLRSKNGSAFISVTGDSLDCTTYRAWAPGYPRRYRNKFDCVLITRYRTWKSTPCRKNYPILCELIPGGPYKRGSIFDSRIRKTNETENTNEEE